MGAGGSYARAAADAADLHAPGRKPQCEGGAGPLPDVGGRIHLGPALTTPSLDSVFANFAQDECGRQAATENPRGGAFVRLSANGEVADFGIYSEKS